MTTKLRSLSRRKPDELTSGQVATLLGVSPRMVLKWADGGRLPTFRLPTNATGQYTHRRFRKCDVVAFALRHGMPNPFGTGDPGPADAREIAVALLLWRRRAEKIPREYGSPDRVADRALQLAQSLGVKLDYLDLMAEGAL